MFSLPICKRFYAWPRHRLVEILKSSEGTSLHIHQAGNSSVWEKIHRYASVSLSSAAPRSSSIVSSISQGRQSFDQFVVGGSFSKMIEKDEFEQFIVSICCTTAINRFADRLICSFGISIQKIPVETSAIQRYKAVQEPVESVPNQRPVQLTHHHHQANVTIDLVIQIVEWNPPIASSWLLVLLSLLLNGHSISIKFSWRWSNSFQPDSTDISPTTSIDSNQSNERKHEKVTLNWLSLSSFAISPVIPFISSPSRLIGFSFLSLALGHRSSIKDDAFHSLVAVPSHPIPSLPIPLTFFFSQLLNDSRRQITTTITCKYKTLFFNLMSCVRLGRAAVLPTRKPSWWPWHTNGHRVHCYAGFIAASGLAIFEQGKLLPAGIPTRNGFLVARASSEVFSYSERDEKMFFI